MKGPPVRDERPAFEFTRVTVVRAGRRVLDELTATIPPAGITVVSGPSGAGKTTLLRLCNRLEVPDAGTVSYRGQPLDELDPLVLRSRVGMVFQRPAPFPGTVADNLVDTTELKVASFDRPSYTLPSEFPRTTGDLKIDLFAAVAAISVTRHGAQPAMPTSAEVQTFMNERVGVQQG